MGETRWGRTFFWLVSVGSAVVVVVLLVPLVVPLQVLVPVLFAGLVGLIVLIARMAARPTQRPVDRRRGSTRWLVAVGILGALNVAAVLIAVRVVGGDVWVDPVRITPGPPRGAEGAEARLGPSCILGEGDVPGFGE
jgi:hypothetical protein